MKMRLLLCSSLSGLLVLCVGCSSHSPEPAATSVDAPAAPAAHKAPQKGERAPAGGVAIANEPVERKIIQSATLDVLVSDFDKARADLIKLIESCNGYVAKSDFSGSAGTKRTGAWTVRVPADKFQSFVNEVVGFGQPQRHVIDAEDVTEEYVDLQSDLKNLREKEAKLTELMKLKAQGLPDIYAWEKEIFAVRAEIARREGRLQKLNRLTAMSTIYITLRDATEYVPPTKPVYGNTIRGTFEASVDALADVGRSLLIFLVAAGPWSPLIVVAVLLGRTLMRRARAANADHTALQHDDFEVEPRHS